MKWKHALMPAALSLLGGCVASPVPEGYQGELAHIADSATPRDAMSADFFYLAKINGFNIPESLDATEGGNRDQGASRPVVVIGRDVPAEETVFKLVGHTRYSTPVFALTHTVYDVQGEIKFAPLPHHDYVVKGVLGEAYSAVWLEDKATGKLAGAKIEVKGSAALDTFGKLDLK